ncbi:MAG: aldehyde dehydrogenase [Clostridia bacterium]|nr:aldehyde dehydrogenase [Clostridia bacterium]
MDERHIEKLIDSQRIFFQSGATLSVKFRIEMLKKLRDAVKNHEQEIAAALTADLGKSYYEGYMCEIGLALTEINYMIRHTRKFAKKHKVRTPITQFPAKSYQLPVPFGNVLIMSPWNYPFLLTIAPIADAIAAGNTIVVKPSAYSPATSSVIEKIIKETYPSEYVSVVMGGRKENVSLLEQKFDFIFFTGSQNVGKEVLRHAAENLTPVALELGGKSPCIVDKTANIKTAAKRIVFGKFINCGQTCVAPDYVLCDSEIKNSLVSEIKKQIRLQYGENPLQNPSFGKIVNEKHFERICFLIDKKRLVAGGKTDKEKLKIAPTVLDKVAWNDAIMQEEIFGPVLPVLTFDKFDEIFDLLADKPKPLALYLFSNDKKHIDDITHKCRYGGGCINDTIMHIATTEMGFGGVGESGMGAYHGKVGFDTFSHKKSLIKKSRYDLLLRYQPITKGHFNIIKKFLK